MNTATRVLNYGYFPRSRPIVAKPLPGLQLKVFVLVAAVLISALGLLYVKDLNRRIFINYQTEQQTTRDLHTVWGKLLLEESTWSEQSRIQRIAEQRLGMYVPTQRDIVMVKM